MLDNVKMKEMKRIEMGQCALLRRVASYPYLFLLLFTFFIDLQLLVSRKKYSIYRLYFL